MTTNYNFIYIPKKTTYKVGDVFKYDGLDWRLKLFDGLRIIGISFNFGDVLEFSRQEWEEAKRAPLPLPNSEFSTSAKKFTEIFNQIFPNGIPPI